MTRDEAIRKAMAIKGWADLPNHGPRYDENAVAIDVFVALGMFRPDEPKSVRQRAMDVLEAEKAKGENISVPWNIVTILENAGLRIVEK